MINDVARRGHNGCVSTPHRLASEAALDVLRQGGNAIDAAVVAATVSTVVQPFSSGVGGGGWATVHRGDGFTEVLEFHGRIPRATTSDMFTPDSQGLIDGPALEASGRGLLGSLVPGAPAGWEELLRRHGTWTLEAALQPAIELAANGFEVSDVLNATMAQAEAKLAAWPSSRALFLRDGAAHPVGATLRQPDIAATLRTLAVDGAAALYEGELGRRVAQFYQHNRGTLTSDDLATYQPRWSAPLRGTFRGHTVLCAPAPLGDLAFVQGLHILDALSPFVGPTDPDYVHTSLESAKLVRRDRDRYLGESPDAATGFDWLVAPPYVGDLVARIGPGADRDAPSAPSPSHTITLVTADRDGNAVHLMQTVGAPFGTGAVVDGTGIVTNSSMYFAHVDPTLPNGVVGGRRLEQNPVVAMVLDPAGSLRLVVGSPGGKTRVETVRQMIVNVLDYGMDVQSAVDFPRFLSEGPTALLESELVDQAPQLAAELAARGHQVSVTDDAMGTGQGVEWVAGELVGGADRRMESVALAW